MDFINWHEEVQRISAKKDEEKNRLQRILELQSGVVIAYDAKDNYNGYDFDLNNHISILVDNFAAYKYNLYESIMQHYAKEFPDFSPDLWNWNIKNASEYLDRVYCVDRILSISHPDFNYPENPMQINVQMKACRYKSERLLLPVRKSIKYTNHKGDSYSHPRELSNLNNIQIFIWYHWCPIRHDVIIHVLKEPRELFKLLQIEKGSYKERIAGNPLKIGDDHKKAEVLYLDPTADQFPSDNFILVHNPFVH
ncbi:hypothetical protein BK139_13090 [Paenibacillus sp. FSL R5-0490]|uniref:hypothetical protein n=1 Tax=Paenibacillus sp. FSL R5-0490 TaxID=1920424 RepID=UPI00096FC75F|nr:hypothetical protein [Paenibacillus sp. FSL R5-0490]OMF59333.1 hypothetical protein BK139_13090 [Paenibacillus sp. FSL R5-0490]